MSSVAKIQTGVSVTPTVQSTSSQPTSSQSTSSHSDLSSGAVAGIIIGTLIGAVLFIVLALYLLKRYSRRNSTRASNTAYDHVPTAGDSDHSYLELPSTRSRRYIQPSRHSLQPSLSSEPLISANRLSHSPLQPTPRVQSPSTPPRLDSISLDLRDAPFSSWDLGEITHLIRSESVSRLEGPAVSTPPVRKQEQTPLQPQQTMFIHRMLQSRARASDGFFLEHRSSIPSRSTTLNSSTAQPDEERLLSQAECAALQGAGMDQRNEETRMPEEDGELYEESVDDTDSLYSQLSAEPDHVTYFPELVPRQNGSISMPRRTSSRKRPRTPAVAGLSPVAEVPDMPSASVGQSVSRPVSAAANSSLHGQISHGRASPPLPLAIEPLPLLTSTNFGKDSTTSGTPPGSMSSNTGWGSNSSSKASRYPSLATSSIGMSSRSGPRSDGGTTDWHHPPTGLAGLKTLQIGPMHNPHSPVDEHPEMSLTSDAADPLAPVKRAHLRPGTTSSVPEVERRSVTQGGIAHIEVAL